MPETIEIEINETIGWYLERLWLTGLFGATREDVARRLIERAIQDCLREKLVGQR
jgi:hypothetical protein